MVHIRRGTTNTCVFTLKEKQTLDSPTFLFRFTNDMQNNTKVFIAADNSAYTDRYNRFSIIESDTELPLLGQVQLKAVGTWKYEVWEQTSTTSLDPIQATTLLETGTVKVTGNTPENTFVEKNFIQNDTYVEHGSGT